tara:strand:+ start:378 stop:584 length:207 start_codon:yes stop_codon:yes gene_type:complete
VVYLNGNLVDGDTMSIKKWVEIEVKYSEFELEVADRVWNSLSYEEMSRYHNPENAKEMFDKFWKELLP